MEEKKLEALQSKARDARLVNLAEHLIFPYIEDMQKQYMAILINKFAKGEKDFLSEVAYLKAIEDLRIYLTGTKNKGTHAFEKLEKL